MDNAGVEAANPNPFEPAGVELAGTDAVDDGKLNPDADEEIVLADVLAGSEKEGIEGGERFSEDEGVGAADTVVDPDVDRPKKEDGDDCVWFGIAAAEPNAELAGRAAGVTLELKENPEKGFTVGAADDAAVAGLERPPNPKDGVALD